MPNAEPTTPAVGHELGAAVVVGSGSADTVGVEAPGDGDSADEPPHATRPTAKKSTLSANGLDPLSVN